MYRILFLIFLLFIAVPFTLPAQSTPKTLRIQWFAGRRYVSLHDIARFYGMSMNMERNGRITLVLRNAKIVMTLNKRYGSLNGIAVTYLYAPAILGGRPYISELDFSKVIEPVMRNATLSKRKVRTIMIDPGHGGKDNGAPGANRVWEKHLTLAMSLRLRDALRAKGFNVIMTRSNDRYPSLEDRVNMREKTKADLFISVHCNASVQKSINGIETYALTPAGAPSSGDSRANFTRNPGNSFDRHNYRLAYEIQRQLVWKTKANDRGVRHARFYVIKNVSCPGVLIETGYLSNAREGSQLQTWRRQRDTVNAIVEGVMRYVSATAPAEKKPKPRKSAPKKPAPKAQLPPASKGAKAEPEAGPKTDRKPDAPLLKPAPKDDGTLLQPVPPLLKPAPKDDGTLLKPVPKHEKPSMKMIPKAAPDPGTRAKHSGK